jgi:hypothetical protein
MLGPLWKKGWFADVNPLKLLAICPMSALIHAKGRSDVAIAAAPKCFPAAIAIATAPTQTKPISDIRVGDTVLAFNPSADLGRGALVPRKVVRLYRNTTGEWVKLAWVEDAKSRNWSPRRGTISLTVSANSRRLTPCCNTARRRSSSPRTSDLGPRTSDLGPRTSPQTRLPKPSPSAAATAPKPRPNSNSRKGRAVARPCAGVTWPRARRFPPERASRARCRGG